MRGVRTPALEAKAIALRKRGLSFKNINRELGVPLPTLSGWLRDVPLTENQKENLLTHRQENLARARQKASQRHREMKRERVLVIRGKVDEWFGKIDPNDLILLELALAMLYLGEGAKGEKWLGLGNSDPMIMRFYVSTLDRLYGVRPSSLQAELHLRADQDENVLQKFWSAQTGIPVEHFKYVVKDKRTVGRPTYKDYKGVCLVTGGGLEIQRRLLYLAEVFCLRTQMRG